MFKQLQEQHAVWALRNFGEQNIEDYELGLIEEVGELAHSFLKRKQGIRNTENHDMKIRDAVGDITIFLVGFCNCTGIDSDLSYRLSECKHYNDSSVKNIASWVNNLIKKPTMINVLLLIYELKCFCHSEGIKYEQTVLDTWENVVSKRNWRENPDNEQPGTAEDNGYPV